MQVEASLNVLFRRIILAVIVVVALAAALAEGKALVVVVVSARFPKWRASGAALKYTAFLLSSCA